MAFCSANYKLHYVVFKVVKEGVSEGPGAWSSQEAARGRSPPAQNLLQGFLCFLQEG